MDVYLFLAASLVPLAVGPLIARWAERSDAATAALDAFVAVAVGGISLLHVFPHAYGEVGPRALLALALGFVLPLGLGHHHGPAPRTVRPTVILIAFLGLAVHATLDGLALFGPQAEAASIDVAAVHDELAQAEGMASHDHQHASASLLAMAVILHRLPMALAIWWIAVPSLGRRVACGLLVAIASATLAGFFLGGRISGMLSSSGLALLQAAIAGMLLHMVLGHHEHHSDGPPSWLSRAGSMFGVTAGGALLAVMTSLHPFEQRLPSELGTVETFLALTFAAAPMLVLAYLGLALIYSFAPTSLRALWLVSPRREEVLADGSRSSMAECALLVLRPEVQLPVFVLSWALLGPWLTLWRLAAMLVIVGLALLSIRALIDGEGRPPAREKPDESLDVSEESPPNRSLVEGLRFGFGVACDRTMPWTLVGLGFAAFLEPLAEFAGVQTAQGSAQIAFLALLGVPLYLLGLGATPIAAVLAHKGFELDGVLIFLLAGVAVSGARRLKTAFGPRVAWGFAVRLFVLAFVAAYSLSFSVPATDLHAMAAREPGPIALLSAFGLLAVAAASLYRQGFRRFLRPSAAMERWHGAGL